MITEKSDEWKNYSASNLDAGSLKKYTESEELPNNQKAQYNRAFSVSDIDILKAKLNHIGKKIIVKGIMTKEDAITALDHGADAIWISNGSHMKSAPSTINVLRYINYHVRNKYPNAEIFVDSNATRGIDILKCIAYGANAVFLTQPILLGLRYNGREGVKDVMNILNEELKLAMAQTKCFNLSEVTEARVIG